MSQGKESVKIANKFKEKKVECVRDRGRGMRNSVEKAKNEIPEMDDRSKQSNSEKEEAKLQATQDSSTSATFRSDTNSKKKIDSISENSRNTLSKEERRKEKEDKQSEKSKRGKKGVSEDEKGHLNSSGVEGKVSAKASVLNEDSRNLRSKINFSPGAKLEARDFTERWYAAKVVEVDWEDEEVLVHFEKWSSRFDEWISMDSPRLRPPLQSSSSSSKSRMAKFKEGDKVMAFWLDRQKYPAKVVKVLPNDNYEIRFYDGYSKTINGKRMAKATDKEIEKAKKELPKATLADSQEGSPSVPSSIFSDTDIGTKEDRRRRKRKLNVAGLFSKSYRQSSNKNETPKKEQSPKVADAVAEAADKSENKVDSQNDEESPEEGRLVFDSEDEAEEFHLHMSDSVEESPSPPRGKGMRMKFKPPSKDIKDSSEVPKKKKVNPVDDSSTDFLRLRFKSRKSTPGARKKIEAPPEKVPEAKTPRMEVPTSSRKQTKEPIHVPDKKLPTGWRKFAIRRKIGASAGKWDIYMQSPEGRKIRSPHALRAFFAKRGVEHVNLDRFDFAPSKAVFPRDGGRPALALSPEEVAAMDAEKEETEAEGAPGPAMRLSAGGPKVLLPKVTTLSPTPPKRMKTLLPRARGSVGDFPGEPPPPSEHVPLAEATEVGEALWKENNCKMDSTYICPKEGCAKNFRKENLLQMHIKHYHPEYCKLVGSAPNVADLASARMDGGESVFDFRPARVRPSPVDSAMKGRGRGRWGGAKRGAAPKEGLVTSPETKPASEDPSSTEPEASWDTQSSTSSFKTVAPATADTSQETVQITPSLSGEIDTAIEDGVQLVQEVVSETLIAPPTPPRRRLMAVGKRKRRLTFLPTHMAKRRKFAMRSGITQGVAKQNVEEKVTGEDSGEVVSTQKGSVNIKRHVIVDERKIPVVQLQKLKVTTDSQGRVILSQPLRKSSEGFLQKGVKSQLKEQKNEGEKKMVSGIAAGLVGSGIRRRRKRRSELLSREEIVNCVCGSPEEEGLMMQCELCLCWQHGHCNNIEREAEVPEKYICYICLNPQKERKSMKYFHDQDWLKKGILPSVSFRSKSDEGIVVQRSKVLKKSHELTGSLLQLKTVVHSLRVKVNMIGKTDHPKLYLWSKSWETAPPSSEVQENDVKEVEDKLESHGCSVKCESPYGDITKTEDNLPELTMEQGTPEEKDERPLPLEFVDVNSSDLKEEVMESCDLKEEKQEAMNADNLDTSATLSASSGEMKQSNSMNSMDALVTEDSSSRLENDLLQGQSVGDEDCPPVLELPLSHSELQQLASTVEDKLRATAVQKLVFSLPKEVRAPQPEAPIDPLECQFTLLDHIESMQQEVDQRLTLIEAQVAALEAEDDDIASDEPLEFYPRTKQTIQMIVRDLNTARRIASFYGKL